MIKHNMCESVFAKHFWCRVAQMQGAKSRFRNLCFYSLRIGCFWWHSNVQNSTLPKLLADFRLPHCKRNSLQNATKIAINGHGLTKMIPKFSNIFGQLLGTTREPMKIDWLYSQIFSNNAIFYTTFWGTFCNNVMALPKKETTLKRNFTCQEMTQLWMMNIQLSLAESWINVQTSAVTM